MNVVVASSEELRASVETAVEKAVERAILESVPKAVRRGELPQYIRQPKLQEITGWSPRQIAYLKAKRLIPYIKKGRSVLFPTQDVLDWIEEGRIPARKRPAQSA